MALIKCVECGREISSRAAACPSCGCPIDASAQAVPSPVSPSNPPLRSSPIARPTTVPTAAPYLVSPPTLPRPAAGAHSPTQPPKRSTTAHVASCAPPIADAGPNSPSPPPSPPLPPRLHISGGGLSPIQNPSEAPHSKRPSGVESTNLNRPANKTSRLADGFWLLLTAVIALAVMLIIGAISFSIWGSLPHRFLVGNLGLGVAIITYLGYKYLKARP